MAARVTLVRDVNERPYKGPLLASLPLPPLRNRGLVSSVDV